MNKRILVVDDEADVVETIKFCLEQEGFEVLTAYDGEKAMDIVCNDEPDLVLLDVMLPKENVYRVSRFIKESQKKGILSKDIFVLLLTARKLDHDPERERKPVKGDHHLIRIFLEYCRAENEEVVG